MIWPGPRLPLALVVPAVMSLGLLVPGSGWWTTAIVGVDLVIAGVAIVDLISLIGASRLTASRDCARLASLDEPHAVELTIGNEGRRRLFVWLKDDLPSGCQAVPTEFRVAIAGRGQITVGYEMTPERRGSFLLERVHLTVMSRWWFWQRAVKIPCATPLVVYPDFKQITRYTLLARRDRLSVMGLRRSRKLGSDNEFERLRDYARGDEPRHIDWRATARRRKLTVRDFQLNHSQRVVFLIDSGRMMAGDVGGGRSPLDHAFNAMLMLAHIALVRGDQVGLLVYSDRVRTFVPPGGGPKRINRLVHAVHNIFPELAEPRHDRAYLELERRCRKRSLVIQLTNVFDDVGAQQLLDHLGNLVGRHLPLAVFLRDGDLFELADAGLTGSLASTAPDGLELLPEAPLTGLGLYESAAAASMLNWRERVLAELRSRGVMTLDVLPEDLTAPLINRYLEVKARHLL